MSRVRRTVYYETWTCDNCGKIGVAEWDDGAPRVSPLGWRNVPWGFIDEVACSPECMHVLLDRVLGGSKVPA